MTHLEDLVLEQGSLGAMKIQNHLWSIQTGGAQLSTKYDGSPSIFAGWDDNGFFVSTKSYLNKTPIVYRTYNEIQNSGLVRGLKDKLILCLHHLDEVVPRGMVLQGDLLFTQGDVTWDGEYCYFHPNTLVYGVPEHWWKVQWSVGVVWHSWIAKDGSVSKPQFGRLLTNENVLSIDPMVSDYVIDGDIVTAPKDFFDDIDMEYLDMLCTDKWIITHLKQTYNKLVREDQTHLLCAEYVRDEAMKKLDEKISALVQPQAIDKWSARKVEIKVMLSMLPHLNAIFDFQEAVRASKRTIINSLDSRSKIKTWAKTNDGLVPTAHEGYVVIGQSESLKIVDRQQFSHMNFNANYIKGWNEPTRT